MLSEFSSQERKILWALAAIVFLSQLALAFRPLWQIATRPFIDDAFYVFSISKNIAAGNGITIDGVHLTNGFQPLIAFFYVPIFWVAHNNTLALQLIFFIVAATNAVAILFLAKLIRLLQKNTAPTLIPILLRPPIFAAVCWGMLHAITLHTMNGLETGLYALLLFVDTYVYLKLRQRQKNNLPSLIGFGVLLGITVLTRIDSVFLVIIIGALELYQYRKKGILPTVIICITAFLLSCPWWIYNYFGFGSIMPQSGQAEAIGNSITMNISFAATSIANISTIAFFFSAYAAPVWVHYLWLLLMVTFFVVLFRKLHVFQYLKTNTDLSGLLPLALFALFVIGFYTFLFRAPFYLDRYFLPFRILWVIVIACLMPLFYRYYRSIIGYKKQILRVFAGILTSAAIAFNLYGYIHHFFPKQAFLYQAAEWALRHPQARIGMGESGTTGFFANNVTNLDGKVNIDALRAIQHSEIGEYVKNMDFDYIADIISVSEPIIISAARYQVIYEKVDSIDAVIIYKKSITSHTLP